MIFHNFPVNLISKLQIIQEAKRFPGFPSPPQSPAAVAPTPQPQKTPAQPIDRFRN
jgi:hypothetical protein